MLLSSLYSSFLTSSTFRRAGRRTRALTNSLNVPLPPTATSLHQTNINEFGEKMREKLTVERKQGEKCSKRRRKTHLTQNWAAADSTQPIIENKLLKLGLVRKTVLDINWHGGGKEERERERERERDR